MYYRKDQNRAQGCEGIGRNEVGYCGRYLEVYSTGDRVPKLTDGVGLTQ